MLTDDAYVPLPLILLKSQNHILKGMIEAKSRKNGNRVYHMRLIARLDWSKPAKH